MRTRKPRTAPIALGPVEKVVAIVDQDAHPSGLTINALPAFPGGRVLWRSRDSSENGIYVVSMGEWERAHESGVPAVLRER